ncbi:cell division protein FtsQ/DivIB [Marinilactibacillus piezotolerans]|uniref:cell division protein FtsQ/DivIB n=1 Tax=Marinilactibacillus piezotolerans TaxID=258723 RepID=UPI0009AFA473|nr:cell division protein FtsQ/DivIB [Marinilactibacillus piezotolerans]
MKQNQEQPVQSTVTDIKDLYSKKNHNSPRHEDKYGKRLKLKWSVLMILFSMMLLISVYFLTPYSKIDTLTVQGSNEVLDQEIIESSEIQSGQSLWETYLEREAISQKVKESLPQVESIELNISGLNQLNFAVSEYQTVALLIKNDQYYKVLENGAVLEEANPNTNGGLPIMRNFNDSEVLEQMMAEYNTLSTSVQAMISEVEWVESERNSLLIKAYMNNGNEILASIPSFSERMQHYPQLVKAVKGENGLFDLEAGAYFIPFASEDEQSYDEENQVDLNETSE